MIGGENASSRPTSGEKLKKPLLLLQKKLSRNRAEQRRTGGGLPVIVDLTDIEERALALVGTHSRLATMAAAEPPQPAARPHARTPSPEGGGAGTDSPDSHRSGAEEHRFWYLLGPFSTDDNVDFEESASPISLIHSTPMISSAPVAIPTSTVAVPGPNTLPQGTPGVSRTTSTKRKLLQRSRSAPRAEDLSGDMVHLSRRSVDIGQQIQQTMGGISLQLASMSATMTEYVPRLAEVLELIARNTGGRGLPVVPECGTAPQGATSPLPMTHESQEEDLASDPEDVPTSGPSSPVSVQAAVLPSSPPMKQRLRSSSARRLGVRRGRGRVWSFHRSVAFMYQASNKYYVLERATPSSLSCGEKQQVNRHKTFTSWQGFSNAEHHTVSIP
uniref:uncharacterized protein n=1 Tax=Pristiophorus japonicus TaxID=55135 RepID=UPI00398EC291